MTPSVSKLKVLMAAVKTNLCHGHYQTPCTKPQWHPSDRFDWLSKWPDNTQFVEGIFRDFWTISKVFERFQETHALNPTQNWV